MDEAFSKIFSVATAAWAALCLNAVALFKVWPHIMERLNERYRDTAAEKASDWQRLREENKRLHQLLAICQTDRVEWMGRAITAEATLLGMGIGRQQVAEVEAAKRMGKPQNGER